MGHQQMISAQRVRRVLTIPKKGAKLGARSASDIVQDDGASGHQGQMICLGASVPTGSLKMRSEGDTYS